MTTTTCSPAEGALEVEYAVEAGLDLQEFINILNDSGLGATRPMEDPGRLGAMLANADLIVTARFAAPNRQLIGIARCLTDFCWSCYLSELAVAASAQGHGVGAGLLKAVRERLGGQVSVILGSVPSAVGFYEKTGMTPLANTFWHQRDY